MASFASSTTTGGARKDQNDKQQIGWYLAHSTHILFCLHVFNEQSWIFLRICNEKYLHYDKQCKKFKWKVFPFLL